MRKYLRFGLLLLFIVQMLPDASAQQGLNLDENLKNVEYRLNVLADSLVPGLNETANFSVVNTSIQELLRGVAETHRLNISVDPSVQARITNNFTNVKVKNLILFLCKEYRLNIEFINTILSFQSFKEPLVARTFVPKMLDIQFNREEDRLSVDLKQDSLTVFARQLTRSSNKNVIIAPNVPERLLNGYISNMPFEQALSKIAYTNSLELEKSEDGFFILKAIQRESEGGSEMNGMMTGARNQRSTAANRGQEAGNYQPNSVQNLTITPVFRLYDTILSVEAINVPIKDVIQEASKALGKDYILFSDPPGNTISNIQNITYDELLKFLLHGTTHTYQKQANVYLMGDRAQEGFRTTRLIRFQFRTIEDIEKVIPTEISKGVQVTPFKELNGIILSGSVARVAEIESFLKAIDQPVPNIMIEVIVVDVRKGTILETGLAAAFGDSSATKPTGGKILPGVDVNFNSSSINGVLDKLEDAGVINLGRVRPNFYASIKALEQNDNIHVRSTPKLSTLNGHEAELSIGQSVYYLEQTQNVTGGVNPIITNSQRFNKVDANLAIKIVPVVSGDEYVTLKISAEFSDFIPPTIENAPPGNATRKFVSQIRVMNEDMIVLGGLEEARKERTATGFPILSRIPVLKWIFSQKVNKNRDDRLMIFIRPTIVY